MFRPQVTYGRSARHPPCRTLVSQSLGRGRLLGCKSLFLSEKSLTASEVLPFVDATLGVGRACGAAADREMHTLTPTRIPDYARTL